LKRETVYVKIFLKRTQFVHILIAKISFSLV